MLLALHPVLQVLLVPEQQLAPLLLKVPLQCQELLLQALHLLRLQLVQLRCGAGQQQLGWAAAGPCW